MLKGILWDNDGVLVNTEHLFYEANCRLLGEYGVALSPQEYFDWFLQDDRGPWHRLEGFGVGDGIGGEGRQGLSVRRMSPNSSLPAAPSVVACLGGQSKGTETTSRPPTSRAASTTSL